MTALDGVGGDGAVPVAVPQPLRGSALGQQDPSVRVEDEAGERPMADPVAGVRVKPVHGPLLGVVGIDSDHVLQRVLVVRVGVGPSGGIGDGRVLRAHAR